MKILQEKRTLDDVLKSGVRTYKNGCNYRLVKELDDNYYIEYGCDGVLINLVTGDERLLYKWFIEFKSNMRKLSGIVNPETILYLLAKHPCTVCGGAKFKVQPK